MQLKQLVIWTVGIFGTGLSPEVASASQVFVGNRGNFPSSDQVDWAVLGNDAYPLSDPFSINSSQGMAVTVNETGSGLGGSFGGLFDTIRQDGSGLSGGTLAGNFAPGEILLYALDGGTVTLSFSQGIYGGGAQIAVPTPTASGAGPFTAEIQAFDQNNHLIAGFTSDGIYSSAADNSAPFLGIMSSSPNIYKISFTGLTPHYGVFLDRFDLITSIPEPSSAALIGLGLLSLAGSVPVRRRK